MARFDRLYLFCAVNYFAQGMAGIVYEPVNYLLKDGLRLSAGETAAFVGWMTLPFILKPIFGLLSDLAPIRGSLRRPHLILGALLGASCWAILAWTPRHNYAALLTLLILVNFSVVFCDAVCDGVMVQLGQAGGKTGTYQAVQIGTLYATLVLTGVGGGWLSGHARPRAVFALAAVFPLLVAGSAVWVRELPSPASPRQGLRSLLTLLSGRRFWALCLMIFLWNFSPFLGTAQFYYQSEALRLGPLYIGVLSTLGGVAGVLGAAFFGMKVRLWGTAAFLRAGVLLAGASSLLYLFYVGPVSAGVLTVIFGVLGVVFRLALMDLAAQSCPAHAQASAFAIYMAVFNLAALASNTAGGRLYDALRDLLRAAPDPAYGAAAVLVVIGSVCTLACWWLLPAVGAAPQRPTSS
ncbi:MAG TPA: hypothetical protein DEB40_10680 [Elusimicrobia bacterium]|nr:hypothetical protein [Elusimicrobiota bacterium]HBT62195.1 hypothetical protein [Elusimicrobiota bacterium]